MVDFRAPERQQQNETHPEWKWVCNICLVLLGWLGWVQLKRCGARYLPHFMHGRVQLRESIAFACFRWAFLEAYDHHSLQYNILLRHVIHLNDHAIHALHATTPVFQHWIATSQLASCISYMQVACTLPVS
jgi:hypothetical protein